MKSVIGLLALSLTTATALAGSPFVVVELFTSEGCSSCPPAEAYLNQLVKQAREQKQPIFPLAFHVDYWNELGWPDPYAQAAFSRRQREYRKKHRDGGVYTPQMIVNGASPFVGSDRASGDLRIKQALLKTADNRLEIKLAHQWRGDQLQIKYQINQLRPGVLLRLALVSSAKGRKIPRGENKGRYLKHENVVRELVTRVIKHNQGDLRLKAPGGILPGEGMLIAYLQDAETWRILSAAGLEL